MIHERKVGKFDFSISKAEHFSVHKVVVAHIVYLDPAIVIFLKKLYDIILAIPEQLVESLARQAHSDHPIRDVAQVEVELAVLVSIAISGDHPLDDGAFSGLGLALLAQIYLLKKVGVGTLAESIELGKIDHFPLGCGHEHHGTAVFSISLTIDHLDGLDHLPTGQIIVLKLLVKHLVTIVNRHLRI